MAGQNDRPSGRRLKARAPLAIAPVLVSQLTSLATFGLNDRRFLELIRARKVPHTRVGKLVLVDVEDLRAALAVDRSEAAPAADSRVSLSVDDEQPEDVDQVLAAIGRRRAS